MSTGETPGEIFAANAHRLYFMLFAYFYLHHILDKLPTWNLFTLILKKSLGEESEKNRPREDRNKSPQGKKKTLPKAKGSKATKVLGLAKSLAFEYPWIK